MRCSLVHALKPARFDLSVHLEQLLIYASRDEAVDGHAEQENAGCNAQAQALQKVSQLSPVDSRHLAFSLSCVTQAHVVSPELKKGHSRAEQVDDNERGR